VTAGQVGALLIALDAAPRPVRARALAAALHLPPDQVRAALRQQQNAGVVHSDGRRWTTTINERGN
jgi:DNA-binding IclR family transcriptional regulator